MVFNWFRRQHNDSSSSQGKQGENASVKEPQAEQAATTETAQEVAASDLLAYAKAAYKNIQEKQQSQPAEISKDVAPSETLPSKAEAEDLDEVSTAEKPEVESTNTLSETPQISTEVVAEEATDRHLEELNEPKAPVSFLERAAAERQAKQERLIASAIAVPEPEIVLSHRSATEEIPEMSFDEGFLWSAEVLAAQGRLAEDVSIEEITWLKKLRQGL
jgi:fused signal recognition particle receptor